MNPAFNGDLYYMACSSSLLPLCCQKALVFLHYRLWGMRYAVWLMSLESYDENFAYNMTWHRAYAYSYVDRQNKREGKRKGYTGNVISIRKCACCASL